MFNLIVNRTSINYISGEPLVSGAKNIYQCSFIFDEDWNGLDRTAVFQAGENEPVKVLLNDDNTCKIPGKVLLEPNYILYVGVLGTLNGEIILPTNMISIGNIREGVPNDGDNDPQDPDIYGQILSRANEAVNIAQSVRDDADKGLFNCDTIVDLTPYATKEWTMQQIVKIDGQQPTSENLLPKRTTEHSSNGITFTPTEEGYHVSGTATSLASYAIYKNFFPDGIEPGCEYYLEINSTPGVYMTVLYYLADDNEYAYGIPILDAAYESSNFIVPADAVAIAFRILVKTNTVVDTVLSPRVYKRATLAYPNPMLTIIDDDGSPKFATLLLPVIQNKKAPIASAVVGEKIGTDAGMSIDTIKTCAVEGAEILSHSWGHLTEAKVANMTQHEIQYDYQKMKNYLISNGINSNSLVFCGNSGSLLKCVNAAQMVYDYAFCPASQKTNKKYSTHPYKINRWSIDPNDTLTSENLQAMLDGLADAGTGWMIWMIHTSNGSFQQTQADIISAMIDYARSKEIDVVTSAYGIKKYVDESTN